MQKVYSEIEPDKLLFSLLRYEDLSEYRTDISPTEEYLQVSGRYLKKNTKVDAHKHIPLDRHTDITQEAWVILKGRVKSVFYDLDDSVIFETEIKDGDCIVLYRGGHSLEVLEEDTIFYEFKTGPYCGIEADKENLDV